MEHIHALGVQTELGLEMKGMERQTRSPRLVGDGVVWLLVLIELLTYGLLFASFAFARWREPEVFAAGQADQIGRAHV